jgi:hypothetical protein
MTPTQLAAWKADIATNQNETPQYPGIAISAMPIANTDYADAIAKWYNITASPDWYVWRNIPIDTVLNLVTFASMTPVDSIPSVTSLPASPTNAQNATYNNQMATVHQWNARSLSCQGKQFNLQNLTIGRTIATMKTLSYRAALQDCLTSIPAGAGGATIAANWVGVRDAAKSLATRLEKLFSTGTGSLATPADLTFEGTATYQDLQA